MASRIMIPALTLAASLLVPALAQADPPEGTVETTDGAFVVSASDDIAPVPIEGPTAPAETTAPPVDVYETYEEPYYPEPYEPEPERRTTLKLESGYFSFGLAPGMTLHSRGFHPLTRFEMEFGGTLEHRYRDLALSFGVVTQMTPYFERKKLSGGVDITSTLLLGPIYLRTGLGAVAGLPRGKLLHDTLPGVGGVAGIGLNFGREPMLRVGVDYDLRINTQFEATHTVLLVVRIACCRKD